MAVLSKDLLAQAQDWLAHDFCAETAAELAELLQAANAGDKVAQQELESAFSAPLAFGTAGLRGPLGPGPARMNRVVVCQAAAGFAAWLHRSDTHGKVIVGFDARHNSQVFAHDTAEVLAGAGFEALLCDAPMPTPVVAFGIQHYGCVAAVVVTASHNPPQDNGYKVYLADGSQIVSPADHEIETLIRHAAAADPGSINRGTHLSYVGDDLIHAYVQRAASLVTPPQQQISWVYTPLHGVGAKVVDQVVAAAGFPPAIVVSEQVMPDPSFPTVPFPNPEEKGAIDRAIALADDHGVDVVIANDPDADRCAVAIKTGSWRMLTGDELGVLLGDDALKRHAQGKAGGYTFANSVVSSTLLAKMCATHGVPCEQTLTGFKWIGRVPRLAYGYEEAIGYCTDPAAVPDKDGITALLRVLAMTAELKAVGKNLQDRLDEIMLTYGLHLTSQLSVRVSDLSIIATAMAKIRSQPPTTLLGQSVTVKDLADAKGSLLNPTLPATDAIELAGESVHVVVRPSGTEPKLKCYLEYRQNPQQSKELRAAQQHGALMIEKLRAEMITCLGLS